MSFCSVLYAFFALLTQRSKIRGFARQTFLSVCQAIKILDFCPNDFAPNEEWNGFVLFFHIISEPKEKQGSTDVKANTF